MLGSSGGQALLVGSSAGQQGTLTLLQQGSQQILLPPGALKSLQSLKVIPITQGKNVQQGKRSIADVPLTLCLNGTFWHVSLYSPLLLNRITSDLILF